MESYIGLRLGPYQIVEQIGRGGMATVFKAYQASMDRYVAVKILPAHLTQDATFVARFEREARTLARLEHPHILPVHDYGEQDGVTYLVMRYVRAGTLKDLIDREGPPALKESARLIDQVGGALDYAHGQSVLHRDIKPSNVLVDGRRDTFLTDFGIAKLVAESAQFTASGAIIGTPAYMAPEQGLGEPVDSRCDIYSLGVLLYELVTGRVPYEAETPLAVVLKHINDPLPMPRLARPDLPEAVERVILKAMAKAPGDRWRSSREMADALNEAVAGPVAVEARGTPASRPIEPAAVTPAEPEAVRIAGQAVPPLAPAAPPAPAAVERPVEDAGRPAPTPAPGPAPTPPARRRLPWLPIAGAAVGLIAVLAVLLFVFGNRQAARIPAAATEEAAPAAGAAPSAEPGAPGGSATGAPTVPPPAPSGNAGTTTQTPAVPASGTAAAQARLEPGWTGYSNANLALAVARQGDLLWVGSEGGLVRWDLAADSYVKLGVADGLVSGRINDLLVDGEGVLWVATCAGISRLEQERWTTFDEADGLDSGWIEALWLDANGALWAGTNYGERGLNYNEGSGWGPPPIPPLPVDEPAVTALIDDASGLYVGLDRGGLAQFRGQEWSVLAAQDGLPGDSVWDLMLAGGALWAGFEDGLVRLDPATGTWEKVKETEVYAMSGTSGGPLWFGTWRGAVRFDPDTGDWQLFEAPPAPLGRSVSDIGEADGGVWLSTYGEGAAFYDGAEWKSWMTDDRIGGNVIDSVRQGADGSIWVTHAGTGLSRYNPAANAWQAFGDADGALDWPSAPGFDSKGNVWTARDGLMVKYDGRGWQSFAVAELQDLGVQAIEIGPDDVQWLITDGGLLRHDPAAEQWTAFTSADHPVLEGVNALLVARDGSVWAGGTLGLARFDGSGWSDGSAPGQELRDVKDLAEAADGSLWLAADGDLVHLEGGRQVLYRWTAGGYLDRLAVAPDGGVWVGCWGAARFDPTDHTWEDIGLADGLIDQKVTGIAVTPEGVVWFGTEGGVSRYVPGE